MFGDIGTQDGFRRGRTRVFSWGISNCGCYDALSFNFFLYDPHGFGFSFHRLLHYFAFFDWILLFWNMSFRIDI